MKHIALLSTVFSILLYLFACGGGDRPVGEIRGGPRTSEAVAQARRAQLEVAPERARAKQILFGDLHVHTTYSLDAFVMSLPLLGGSGAHPPADACDFARHCAGLDFFALTDHASELTPEHWAKEKESVRQCNVLAGDPADPDLVAFNGFEWTQSGPTPGTHWGHKNVVFRGIEEEEVPARPIGARGPGDINPWFEQVPQMARARFIDPLHWSNYTDLAWLFARLREARGCNPDLHTRELPPDCQEVAHTPDVLFRKLDEWGLDALVIPHGNTWGNYTPPTSSWDSQLTARMHDPDRQKLIEVMSGHGNSERYQPWREFEGDAEGEALCPEPTAEYLPCCWRAGEIMRERCGDLPPEECEARVEEAMRLTMRAGVIPDGVFPGTTADDWLDCGQFRGGFKPAYSYRPRGSTQYALSLTDFAEAQGPPLRFRFGLIASSDTHSARAATGHKQERKRGMTDMVGPRNSLLARFVPGPGEPEDPRRPVPTPPGERGSALLVERIASFLYPGGAVAAHAEGRDRDAIWQALERREVYGTSGPRILLWFDLLDGEGGRRPMGSEVALAAVPRFEVRAAGAFEQLEGCPDDTIDALSAKRAQALCLGECYHPSDRRHPITTVEVVRIRPQIRPSEAAEALIEDPWRRFECEPDPAGCVVRFEDPEFPASGRDAVYYVRVLQEETPAVNGANLRTRFDGDGRPVDLSPCAVGAWETPGDDCLAPVQERAWSSPIFVDQSG